MKAAVREAMDEKLGEFFVAREEHYQHHQFVKELIHWTETAKGTACSTISRGLVVVFFSLVILGFIFWGKGHFK
ncbi:MAG: hypothetical protein Q8J64_06580 [Thermodesulfovibrionales bacterium]|nr:hypothetical protein [Thermodesulfovibrionales bacterium]